MTIIKVQEWLAWVWVAWPRAVEHWSPTLSTYVLSTTAREKPNSKRTLKHPDRKWFCSICRFRDQEIKGTHTARLCSYCVLFLAYPRHVLVRSIVSTGHDQFALLRDGDVHKCRLRWYRTINGRWEVVHDRVCAGLNRCDWISVWTSLRVRIFLLDFILTSLQ